MQPHYQCASCREKQTANDNDRININIMIQNSVFYGLSVNITQVVEKKIKMFNKNNANTYRDEGSSRKEG